MKRVLITGAGSGIGRACAIRFAEQGFDTVLHCRKSLDTAQTTVQELTARHFAASLLQADLTDAASVRRMFQQAEPVDVLINNAGVSLQKLFTDTTEEDWDRIFSTNMKSMYFCAKEALAGMLRRHSGVIVNISSMWGQTGASCEVAYSASKAAVIGFTKALAKEVGPSGIRVNCIAPGVVDTPMNAALTGETLAMLREETPLGAIGAPEDIAEAALFLAGQGARFITGQVLGVNGGLVI